MNCPHCRSRETKQLPKKIDLGYPVFRCFARGRTFLTRTRSALRNVFMNSFHDPRSIRHDRPVRSQPVPACRTVRAPLSGIRMKAPARPHMAPATPRPATDIIRSAVLAIALPDILKLTLGCDNGNARHAVRRGQFSKRA